MAKTFGDGFQSRPFGLLIERVVGVGAVDDLAQENKGAVLGQLIFFQDCLERAFLAVMAQLDILDIVRNGVAPLCLVHDFFGRREDELGVFVDKLLDQPRAGNAVDFDMFARDPFHENLLLGVWGVSIAENAAGQSLHQVSSMKTAARCDRGSNAYTLLLLRSSASVCAPLSVGTTSFVCIAATSITSMTPGPPMAT